MFGFRAHQWTASGDEVAHDLNRAKKKTEASATITNTMIVVMVVSRRVGQVTLAVSERTSCRNLTAESHRGYPVLRATNVDLHESNSPLDASPLSKDEHQAGSIVRGFQSARISALNGPTAGGGYYWQRAKVKVRGPAAPPPDRPRRATRPKSLG